MQHALLRLFLLLSIATSLGVLAKAQMPASGAKTAGLEVTTLPTELDSLVRGLTQTDGFLTTYYDAEKGKMLMRVPPKLGDFLYIEALATGIGNNDLGLDRGQLGETRLVRFDRAGTKLLLVQPNLAFRAQSNNAAERASVEEAFAHSVLWGFPILATAPDSSVLIELTPFLLQDAHGVATTLAQNEQGNFKVDPLRSALYLERTRNFPRNTEFEALITLTGEAKGEELKSVTPTPDAVSFRQHYSFVALPEPGYEPRRLIHGRAITS